MCKNSRPAIPMEVHIKCRFKIPSDGNLPLCDKPHNVIVYSAHCANLSSIYKMKRGIQVAGDGVRLGWLCPSGLLMQVLVNYCNKSLYKAGHHIIALRAYLGSKLCLNGPILGVRQMLKPCVKQLTEIREYSNTMLKCVGQDLVYSSSQCHNANFNQTNILHFKVRKQMETAFLRPALNCDWVVGKTQHLDNKGWSPHD